MANKHMKMTNDDHFKRGGFTSVDEDVESLESSYIAW